MTYERATPPRRLYKYQAVTTRTLAMLKARTLWFGRPSRFNDPFDCAVPYRKDPATFEDVECVLRHRNSPGWELIRQDRRYVDEGGHPTELLRATVDEAGEPPIRDALANIYWNRGVTCFSESATETLLWSHYGDGHRGMCLEFDTGAQVLNKLHKVTYTTEIPRLNTAHELVEPSSVLRLALTKAQCWAYEREWRAIHAEADKEYKYGVEALTGLYFGAAMPPEHKDLIGHILHGSPTQLYELRRSAASFSLEAAPVTYDPYTYQSGAEVSRPN